MKKLFLLPLVAMFSLVGCGGGEWKSEEVVIPTVEASNLKTAYDAAAALTSGATESMELSGVVVATSGNSFFLQQGYCGMYVYNKAVADLAVGKIVTLTSTYQNYNSLVETKSISSAVLGEDGTLPASIKLLSNEQLGQLRQSILVHGSFEFVEKDADWASGAHAYVKAKYINNGKTMEDEVTIKFDKYAFNAEKAEIVNGLKAGDKFNIAGAVTTAYKASAGGVSNQILFGTTSTVAK